MAANPPMPPPGTMTSAPPSMISGMGMGMNGSATGGGSPFGPPGGNPFQFIPSFSLSLIGSVLFTATALLHLFQFVKTRAWFFSTIVLATLLNDIGFIARTVATLNIHNTDIFLIFTVASMVPPSIIAIGTFMTFTRLIYRVTPRSMRTFDMLWVPPTWSSIFLASASVACDIIRTVGTMAFTDAARSVATQEVGISMQLLVFAGFGIISTRYALVARGRGWFTQIAREDGPRAAYGVKEMAWMLSMVGWLMTIRQIFKIVQFDEPKNPPENAYIFNHEWDQYVFDFLPILLIFVLYNIVHPGNVLPREFTGLIFKPRVLQEKKLDGPPV